MVATTFSMGAPILVAGWSREVGIVKNWEWWCFLMGQMFTTFFFARLWRRTNVFNDAEFISIRYSGGEASFLRGFRALYMGFIMNMVVMGTGLVAAAKFGTILLGISADNPQYETWRWGIAIVCGLTALSYSCLSGFAAIVITDFVGFVLATFGSVLMVVYICLRPEVGGLDGLVAQIGSTMPERLAFFPKFDIPEFSIRAFYEKVFLAKAGVMTLGTVMAYASVRWWAQIYGGAEPGGASHVVQRLVSARSEKDALLGSLWFNIAHYAVRPLPWILAGLGTILIFPLDQFTDHEKVYLATIDFLPFGLKGVVIASLFAAFMTTMDTRLNLGASYFVNDLYKPFVAPKETERHYVIVSRIVTVAQCLVSFGVLLVAENIETLFFIYVGIGSGAGLVYILRFYWWRISAWSEITAMTAALICMFVFRFYVYGSEEAFADNGVSYMFISLWIVTASWLLVTLITRPTDREQLKRFYRMVRPAGPFWKPISTELRREEGIESPDNLKIALIGWLFSNPMTLGYLFGAGNLLLGKTTPGLIWLTVGVLCTFVTVWSVKKMTAGQDEIVAKAAQCETAPAP
jgi:Na+/proline symporter